MAQNLPVLPPIDLSGQTLPPDQQWSVVVKNKKQAYALNSQRPRNYIADTQNHLRYVDHNVSSDAKTMLQTGKAINLTLPRASFARLKFLAIRFRILNESSSVNLAPTADWFREIAISIVGGAAQQTYYPESLLAFLSVLDESFRNALKSTMNFGKNGASWYPSSAEEYVSIPAGEYRYYTIPLPGFLLNKTDGSWLESDINIKIQTRSGGIATSGSGVVTVQEIKFVIQEAIDETDFSKRNTAILKQSLRLKGFFNVLKQSRVHTTAFTSGTTMRIPLDGIPAGTISPGMLVQFRKSSLYPDEEPMSGYNIWQLCDSLGSTTTDYGKLDLIFGGKSVLGQTATTLPADVAFRQMATQYIGSDLLNKRNMYLLAPGDFKQALTSESYSSSWITFTGSAGDYLEVVPYSRTNFVETITLSLAPTVGTFKLQYGESITDPIAYNANAATISAALDLLKTIREDNLICTFSAALSAGTTPTITFTGSGKPRALIKVIPDASFLNSSTVVTASHAWTSLSTDHVYSGGITSGSTYTVDMFVFAYTLYGQQGAAIDVKLDSDS